MFAWGRQGTSWNRAWARLEVDGDNKAATDQAGKCNMTGHGPLVRMVATWNAIVGAVGVVWVQAT